MEYVGIVEEAEEGKPPKIREYEGTVLYLRQRNSANFEEGETVFKDAHGIHRINPECEECQGEMLAADDGLICPFCQNRVEVE